MNMIDLSPLYRSSVGFDRFESLINSALRADSGKDSYPPYNIEVLEENHYAIRLAVAGFTSDEINIQLEQGVLTIRGEKTTDEEQRQYLYQGIANRSFERKFNLAEYIEVTDAELVNGLLSIRLVKELPEAMKPRQITINGESKKLEDRSKKAA